MDIKREKKRGLRALLQKKNIPYLLGALLFVLIVWLLLKDNSSTLRVNTATVTVSNVEEGEFNDYVSLSGTVQPMTTMQISPFETGVVDRIVAEEGSMVKKGDIIIEMSNKQLSMQILQSEADLAEKQNILRNTLISMEQERLSLRQELLQLEIEVNRSQRLYKQNEELYKDALKGVKEQEVFITDCSIDTDMELLIPDSYISLTSEKIRLYKELDTITTEDLLIKFTEDLKDRFGELPQQLVQLTYVVRLRWEAVKLGFERIVLKNNTMFVYFVTNQQSPYYGTPVFAKILNYINSSPKNMSVTEQNKKLLLKIRGIDTIEKGYNVVIKMKLSIFADL